MAFRKRNIPLGSPRVGAPLVDNASSLSQVPGTRSSPLTSHTITSTGTASLDGLLGGHGGLVLGSSILIGEHGTTDYAGALLRYYTAEGILQGHAVHVVGMGEGWVRELPGVAEARYQKTEDTVRNEKPDLAAQERMKIAWRYERLGQAGDRALPDRSLGALSSQTLNAQQEIPFCHTFDLTKRLVAPPAAVINNITIVATSTDPFAPILDNVRQGLASSAKGTVHRLVMPALLSPALYPPHCASPEHVVRFLLGLRALLRQYPNQLTAMLTIPLTLYPRNTALVRTLEMLADCVLEVTPFPHQSDEAQSAGDGKSAKEERPQGLVKVLKLPLATERGEGGAGAGNSIGEDLAFTLSRRKFAIAEFSLPPVEGDQEAQKEAGKVTAKDVEF
ncbi:Elongator subunit elp4 [Oleoguttula sp. CCFEE 5521]